jgi:hypothetical protein
MEATADAIAAGDFRRGVEGTDPHTEPGRLGRAMNAMLGRVEAEISRRTASEQRLRRFLADASHELRTPLTSIRGFAELSRRGGDRTDALRRIEAEAARMGVLVEDLLLLARLDESRELQRRPVDLLELAADLVRDLHARSPGRDVRLAGPIRPVVVPGDPLRLRQVLGNLLANADRHTPPDARITVRVDALAPARLGPAAAAVLRSGRAARGGGHRPRRTPRARPACLRTPIPRRRGPLTRRPAGGGREWAWAVDRPPCSPRRTADGSIWRRAAQDLLTLRRKPLLVVTRARRHTSSSTKACIFYEKRQTCAGG